MWKKTIGYTVLALVCVGGAGFAYLYFRKPASRPAPNVRVASTKERIERGRYIFNLSDCDNCHSPHDTSKQYLPVIEARRGSGQHFPEEGFGRIVAPNITPDPETGIGKWTDGEKIRAIREGIGRDGRALFPLMPYQLFRHMSDEDVYSLVAYINSLPPVRNPLPHSEVAFPVSMFIKSAPRPVTRPVTAPKPDSGLPYGEYLVTIGVCEGCHTPRDGGSVDMSKRFAGGNTFRFAGHVVASANITPDPATGIGNWTEEYFLERFRRHRYMPAASLPAATPENFTIMPWRALSNLEDDDLRAIYRYLQSRPAVHNKVAVHPVQVAKR